MKLPPKVRPGDEFTTWHWNSMREAVEALQPQPGHRTFLRRTGLGFSISYDVPDLILDHPFRAILSYGKITFTPGLVNNVEPVLGGVPMSGVDASGTPVKGGLPTLSLGSSYDSEGRLWIMVEVQQDASGKLLSCKIIQSADPTISVSPFVGRVALAVVKKLNGVPTLFQIVYHNQRHVWLKPRVGIGRHFFSAA